jgi:predicted O-linked N-acetylglucosamine transferase (SPINDLY family)
MPQAHYLNAINLYRNGNLAQAEQSLKEVLALQAKHADALHLLGVVCYQSNRTGEAAQYLQQALSLEPRNVDYINNYGLALRANGQHEAALKSFQQALIHHAKDLDIQLNIANTLLTLNRFQEATTYYRRLLQIYTKQNNNNQSSVSAALCHCLTAMGNQAQLTGHYLQAEACFQEALVCSTKNNIEDAALYYNLANAQRELGKAAEATQHYQIAAQLNPNDADIYNNLGNVQRELGQLDFAIESYEKALSINPKLYHAKVHLVHQKQHCCNWLGLQDDVNEIRLWLKTAPEAQISPFAFLAMPGTTAAEQKTCADHWLTNRYTSLIAQGQTLNFKYDLLSKKPKIKIAYLSADFRLHPLAFLVTELIELHDRNQFEIIAFSYGVNDQSSARTRLEKAFDQFHDIRHLSEIEAAQKINACHIDILVDLTGFTQTSRSGIAALRPAPINVSWLGFPGTMGEIATVGTEGKQALFDYLLSDIFITPTDSAEHYAEKLALLPHSYQANDSKRPVAKPPTRASCNLPENTFVFCCFNQTFKITSDVFAIWLRLLKTTPNSVLWLLDCNRWAKQNLIAKALAQGLTADRLIFAPRIPIADHLARHAHADLFLDTQPYNAHTTCSDALWMGVPVLTCVGDTFSARVAGSLLSAVNLTELITYSLQDYENKALYFYRNQNILSSIKQKLLANNQQSALFNTQGFAQSLETIYQSMWTHYSDQQNTRGGTKE